MLLLNIENFTGFFGEPDNLRQVLEDAWFILKSDNCFVSTGTTKT